MKKNTLQIQDTELNNDKIAHNGFFADQTVNSNRIIYTPTNFAKENLTYLQEVGQSQSLKSHTAMRKDLSSYLFFIVKSGKGTVTYGNVEYEVKAGDCVFINCMNQYTHTSSDDLWTLKWVHFNGNNMDAIYEKYKERGGKVVFSVPDAEEVMSLIDRMYKIAASDSYLRDMEIHEILSSLLLSIMRESWNEKEVDTSSEKRKDLRHVREYIEENYDKKIQLDDLSERYNINKYYLSHIFNEQYGTSITNYIISLRITKAKHYLRFSDMTTTEIANRVGYEDVNYFIRSFKKVENITPGEYKKKW